MEEFEIMQVELNIDVIIDLICIVFCMDFLKDVQEVEFLDFDKEFQVFDFLYGESE